VRLADPNVNTKVVARRNRNAERRGLWNHSRAKARPLTGERMMRAAALPHVAGIREGDQARGVHAEPHGEDLRTCAERDRAVAGKSIPAVRNSRSPSRASEAL